MDELAAEELIGPSAFRDQILSGPRTLLVESPKDDHFSMGAVSDPFLLEVAGISASLLGFFVVGVFFYVERSIFPQAADRAHGYLRAAVGSVIYLYGMVVLLALGLVVLSSGFVSLLYVVLSAGLVWSVARTSSATRRLQRAVGVRMLSQTAAWAATILILGLPWVIGGFVPSRSHFTWGLMLVGVFAFVSTASFVLSAFDLSALEASAHVEPDSSASPQHGDQVGSEAAEEARNRVQRMLFYPNGGEVKKGDTGRASGWLDGRFAQFDHQLKGILGEGRIPSREKRARAEQAIGAVHDLIEEISDELGQVDGREQPEVPTF